MRINSNITALTAYNNLSRTDSALGKNLEKLSSGLRINRAADDAAGLTISENMRAQVKGMNRAIQNAQDGISLVQTAEGGLSEIHSILQRMNELAVQSANGTNNSAGTDRANIQKELDALEAEITNISGNTKFNGTSLLAAAGTVNIQIGHTATDNLAIGLQAATLSALGIDALDVSSEAGADTAMGLIQTAINTISGQRADFGALQNRLDHTINNLSIGVENLTASESRIRDLDVAKEMASFTKNQVLMQAGTSMLAQANAKPQSVLSLLG